MDLPTDLPARDTMVLLLQWLGGLSVLMFLGGILFVPWLITRLPEDYFIRPQGNGPGRWNRHPLLALSLLTLRTLVGLVLLAAGMIMLVLPGQGILTILIGISILEFPGKHRLRDWLLRFNQVRQALNWIRSKSNRPPFIFEE